MYLPFWARVLNVLLELEVDVYDVYDVYDESNTNDFFNCQRR